MPEINDYYWFKVFSEMNCFLEEGRIFPEHKQVVSNNNKD